MIAKNFKFLSRIYKDKQEVLARMLHVPQSNISGYINGKKPIPTDVLNSISVRYNVSIDDLVNKDLSVEYDLPQTVSISDAANIGETLLPILTSNVAKTNGCFIQVYETLNTSLQVESADAMYGKIGELESAVAMFQNAWEEAGTFVALSNSLSIILLIHTFYCQRSLEIGQALLSKGSLDTVDVGSIYLRDPREATTRNPYEKQQKAFFEKYEKTVYENIKLLKSNTYFSELGDYYLAICCFLGFTEDYIEYEVASKAGLCMLFQLYKLENKYASKLLESMP